MPQITVTLSLAEVLALPGEAAIALLRKANPSTETLASAYQAESTGKARWPVLNALRTWKPAL